MINWLTQNWTYIIFITLVIVIAAYALMTGKVKEWLKYAVTIAEKDLGTGTGQLKLRQVYDMFIEQFPGFSTIVPFPIFSKWVDVSLAWLKVQLEQNANVERIVNGNTESN